MIEVFKEIINTLVSLIKNGANIRTLLFVVSVVVATTAYYYISNFFDLDIKIESPFKSKTYKFYSGSPGGFYIHIGEALEQKTRDKKLLINNEQSAGSLENAIKVMTSHKAFGLIQEESLQHDDFMNMWKSLPTW